MSSLLAAPFLFLSTGAGQFGLFIRARGSGGNCWDHHGFGSPRVDCELSELFNYVSIHPVLSGIL